MSPKKYQPILDDAKTVGPFSGAIRPSRDGMYLRVVAPNKMSWAFFRAGVWYGWADNKQKAADKSRRNRRSKLNGVQWYGTTR